MCSRGDVAYFAEHWETFAQRAFDPQMQCDVRERAVPARPAEGHGYGTVADVSHGHFATVRGDIGGELAVNNVEGDMAKHFVFSGNGDQDADRRSGRGATTARRTG